MKLAAILIAVPLAMASALLGTTAEKATSAATDRHHPVLLELFTSQGCSSCPPADRLAERLTKEPGLLVISRPVTYWDRLGWKDTLAREENTQLQRAYAARGLAGENGVFTPQIVIDGNRGAVGSNEAIIRQLIDYEAAAPAALSVRKLGDGSLAVGMAGTTERPAELVLVALRSHVTVRIVAGENGNRSIGYTNVVVDEQVVDKWVGGKSGVHIPASQFRIAGADRYALVLRQKNGGAVLASLPLV
jgi:hypothetical protein